MTFKTLFAIELFKQKIQFFGLEISSIDICGNYKPTFTKMSEICLLCNE